jgi:hypothetical protein
MCPKVTHSRRAGCLELPKTWRAHLKKNWSVGLVLVSGSGVCVRTNSIFLHTQICHGWLSSDSSTCWSLREHDSQSFAGQRTSGSGNIVFSFDLKFNGSSQKIIQLFFRQVCSWQKVLRLGSLGRECVWGRHSSVRERWGNNSRKERRRRTCLW